MNEDTFVGLFMAVILFFGFSGAFHAMHISDAEKAIAECQASLPRDQHCKVTAIPVIKEAL